MQKSAVVCVIIRRVSCSRIHTYIDVFRRQLELQQLAAGSFLVLSRACTTYLEQLCEFDGKVGSRHVFTMKVGKKSSSQLRATRSSGRKLSF